MDLENDMDIKALSACWTTHQQPQSCKITPTSTAGSRSEYAMETEQGLGNKVQEKSAKAPQNLLTDFKGDHAA
ncbi:MAG: hypothetical protein V8R57_01850 [Evtepia sp.]